jgi:hypothetical protein
MSRGGRAHETSWQVTQEEGGKQVRMATLVFDGRVSMVFKNL